MARQLRFLLQEGEDVRENLGLLGVTHACGNLPVGRDTRVCDVQLNHCRRDARRPNRLDLSYAGERPLDQVGRRERNPVTRPMLDLFPERLKIRS